MTDRAPAQDDRATTTASVVAAVVVTAMAIGVLLLLLPDAAAPVVAPTLETTTTSSTAPEAVEVVIPPTPIEVDGLPESITRVLQASGYASELKPGDEPVLPDAVLRVLIERDVVLTVVEDAEPTDRGG